MKITLYKRIPAVNYTPAERILRAKELFLKLSILLSLPGLPAATVAVLWYWIVFKRDIHFDGTMENITCGAWIETFGVLYSLLAASIFNTVWGEYKAMRNAVKQYDLDAFLDLKDEKLSPLVHAMMFMVSAGVMMEFMSLKYQSALCGIIIISSTAYLFSLIFLVVREIDDPCKGIWYIKNIPKEWLEIDPKKWRIARHAEARKKYEARLKANGVHMDDCEPEQKQHHQEKEHA